MSSAGAPTESGPVASYVLREPYRAGALVSLLQLHWFIRLRWIGVGLGFAALGIERFTFPDLRRPVALPLVLLGLAAINILWTGVSHFMVRRFHTADPDETETIDDALTFANAQVGVDLLMLTLILRYTGGIESPMAIFYLFHMAIGPLLLQSWQALLQGVWAVVLYAGLAAGEWVGWLTPHYPFLSGPVISTYQQWPHVAVHIVVLVLGVFGMLYFTLKIAARLDERERQLRRVNDALQKSQVAINDLQQRRSRFMATAAHQLKSPLAGIQTLTSLIRDGIVPAGALHSTCDKIIERCRAGITQVNELLTLARIQEADPRRHHDAVIDVAAVTEELCDRHLPIARDRQVWLRFLALRGHDLRAHVDRGDLMDCVSNLIENAVKYTPGPGKVTVFVRREVIAPKSIRDERREYISVTVADTGIGIDRESLIGREGPAGSGSVFDAFRRGNTALSARIPGTGLGLSIVREVVEQAGGRIRVHSRPGRGSKFTVMFPARQEKPTGPTVRDTRASEIVVDVQGRGGPENNSTVRTETGDPSGGQA